jgi:hypothetical protein
MDRATLGLISTARAACLPSATHRSEILVHTVIVITFYSPEAVIMTSEDFAPQRGAMHQSTVSIVCKESQSQPAVAAALPCV